MPNPGEFRRIIAEAFDMPMATVTSFDRLLAEGGLRTMAGRGRGAPRVSARDSAQHLTAVMASPQVKDAVPSVERYAATRLQRTMSSPKAYADCGIAEFEALGKDHSFIDALEALIIWIAKGAVRSGNLPSCLGAESIPIIEVMATTPATVGDIRISGIGDSVLAARYALPWNEAAEGSAKSMAQREAAMRSRVIRSDLEQFRRISGRTLFQIGEALANDD